MKFSEWVEVIYWYIMLKGDYMPVEFEDDTSLIIEKEEIEK
jgi:hypothetical protein